VEGLVKGAKGGVLAADEGAEEVVAPLVEGAGLVAEAGDEDAGFEARDAAEAPMGGGQLADEQVLVGVGGLELGPQCGQGGGELVGVFGGEEQVAGAQAVEGAVPGGSGLALGGFGAGREPGVAAVGLDLSLGRHSTLRLQGKPGRGGCRGHGRGKWLRGRQKYWWGEGGMGAGCGFGGGKRFRS
jgi:hypothetical protein